MRYSGPKGDGTVYFIFCLVSVAVIVIVVILVILLTRNPKTGAGEYTRL